jgi:hypothetical protein
MRLAGKAAIEDDIRDCMKHAQIEATRSDRAGSVGGDRGRSRTEGALLGDRPAALRRLLREGGDLHSRRPKRKARSLESVIAPKLRTGRFKATDKLIDLLKAPLLCGVKRPRDDSGLRP